MHIFGHDTSPWLEYKLIVFSTFFPDPHLNIAAIVIARLCETSELALTTMNWTLGKHLEPFLAEGYWCVPGLVLHCTLYTLQLWNTVSSSHCSLHSQCWCCFSHKTPQQTLPPRRHWWERTQTVQCWPQWRNTCWLPALHSSCFCQHHGTVQRQQLTVPLSYSKHL